MKKAAIIGSSGLIGSYLLEQLLVNDQYDQIRILVRKDPQVQHPKLKTYVLDLTDVAEIKSALAGSDSVFCAVGTTTKKVKGDKVDYRKVDVDLPIRVAQAAADCGVKHFLLVSSVGANSRSKNFYLKMKGEVEDKVLEMNFPSISIYRPSMLLGERKEFRLGERIFKPVSQLFAFLTPAIYRPIHAKEVARQMIENSLNSGETKEVIHFHQ
jgi:uncharacterized protein YbjT (DUF2867 family)